MVELVIFDLDGTLVDSLPDLADATNHFLAAAGRSRVSVDEVKTLVGQGARRLVERALEPATSREIEEGLERFLAYNEAHIADKTNLYPGAHETLETLRERGIRLALVSNKNEALCRKLLSTLGIDHFFNAILGADSTPFRKPSPEPLLKVLHDFSVMPEHAVMVGDSINDIAAGRAAGVVTVGCTFGYGGGDELTTAHYRIDGIRELLTLPIMTGKQPSSH